MSIWVKGACVHMMSALGGGEGVPQKQTRILISRVNVTVTRGEGVHNFENFGNVICRGLSEEWSEPA